jgi:hypothetical protein
MTPCSRPSAVGRKAKQVTEPAAAPLPILTGPESLKKLEATLIDHYQPATAHEYWLIQDLACERFGLLRRQRACNAVEADVFQTHPEPEVWSDIDFKRIALADRYRLRAERAYQRALKNVRRFCQERATSYRWEARHDLAIRELEFEKKKHELETAREQKADERIKRMDIAA